MTIAWDKFQELVRDEMRKAYSETVIDHAMNPRNVGNMDAADGYASVTGPCGDTMDIWLNVKDNTIVKATFMTDGYGTTIASGSMVTEVAKAKSIGEAQRIDQRNLLDVLGGLPGESQHCALLAANTLKTAVKDYLAMQREPWRKAYRKH